MVFLSSTSFSYIPFPLIEYLVHSPSFLILYSKTSSFHFSPISFLFIPQGRDASKINFRAQPLVVRFDIL